MLQQFCPASTRSSGHHPLARSLRELLLQRSACSETHVRWLVGKAVGRSRSRSIGLATRRNTVSCTANQSRQKVVLDFTPCPSERNDIASLWQGCEKQNSLFFSYGRKSCFLPVFFSTQSAKQHHRTSHTRGRRARRGTVEKTVCFLPVFFRSTFCLFKTCFF